MSMPISVADCVAMTEAFVRAHKKCRACEVTKFAYIAGPVTGLPDRNRAAFRRRAASPTFSASRGPARGRRSNDSARHRLAAGQRSRGNAAMR